MKVLCLCECECEHERELVEVVSGGDKILLFSTILFLKEDKTKKEQVK